MNSRTLLAAAVASACAWPTFAAAAPAADSAWAVSTPSSVDESAPWKAADSMPLRHSNEVSVSSGITASNFSEAITPHSVNESAPWMTAEQTRARNTRAQYASLPNPQTPWSANESAPARYAEEMRERAQHVASVTQARVVVARIESERLATLERERLESIERERLASSAPPAESGTVVGLAPLETSSVESSSSVEERTSQLPVPPGERPAQPDTTASLVDSRSAGTMSLTTTPEFGASDNSNTAAGETSADRSTATAVGVTRSEGMSVSGPSLEVDRDASAEPTAATPPVSSQADLAPSAAEPRDAVDAALAPVSPDGTGGNAYVTMHKSAVDTSTR